MEKNAKQNKIRSMVNRLDKYDQYFCVPTVVTFIIRNRNHVPEPSAYANRRFMVLDVTSFECQSHNSCRSFDSNNTFVFYTIAWQFDDGIQHF